MFPGASALGDSVDKLFSPKQDASSQAYAQLQQENQQMRMERSSTSSQNEGIKDMPGYGQGANANRPTKTQPSATEDPQEVEARWMARLAKFAGITNATGVKLGSM